MTEDQRETRPLPAQNRAKTTQKNAEKHPCLDSDSNPRSQYCSGQDPSHRPRIHCDRPLLIINPAAVADHKLVHVRTGVPSGGC